MSSSKFSSHPETLFSIERSWPEAITFPVFRVSMKRKPTRGSVSVNIIYCGSHEVDVKSHRTENGEESVFLQPSAAWIDCLCVFVCLYFIYMLVCLFILHLDSCVCINVLFENHPCCICSVQRQVILLSD